MDHAGPRRRSFSRGLYNSGGCDGGERWNGVRLERVKRIANCELALCPDYSNRYYPRSSTRCGAGSTLPPGMRFVVILGANRIHVASSTDATSYYAGTGRKLNIVRAPGRASPCASALFSRKIADKPGKNRIVSVGAIEDSDPPVLPFYRFFECIPYPKWELIYVYVRTFMFGSFSRYISLKG